MGFKPLPLIQTHRHRLNSAQQSLFTCTWLNYSINQYLIDGKLLRHIRRIQLQMGYNFNFRSENAVVKLIPHCYEYSSALPNANPAFLEPTIASRAVL